jgi:diguanylate cyclase (GGDEF)-like protein
MDLGKRGFIPCDPTRSILHQCETIIKGYYYFVIYNPKYDLYLVGYTRQNIKSEIIKEELIRILKSFPNVIVAPKEIIQSQKDIVYREFKPFHIFYGIKINRQEIHQLVENAMLPIRSYFKSLFLQYTLWALIGGVIIMIVFYLFMIKRADQLERFFKETEMKALKDPMTSLYNRSGFSKLYQESMKGKCALVLVDLDNFKYINDKFGHEKGDEVLKFFSNLLRSYFPDSLIGRWGGDEFIICTRQPIKEVKNRLYNIQKALRDFQESFDSEMEKFLSISGGVCADRDLSYEEKFKKADLALYKSKKKGKGLILLYRELDYVRMEKEDLK